MARLKERDYKEQQLVNAIYPQEEEDHSSMKGNEDMPTPAQTVESHGAGTPQTTAGQRKKKMDSHDDQDIRKLQMTGELPNIKQQFIDNERKILAHLGAPQSKGPPQPTSVNYIPKIIRMKELSINDYYTGNDRDKDEKAV